MFEKPVSRRSAIAAAGTAGLAVLAGTNRATAEERKDAPERSGATLVIGFVGPPAPDYGFDVATGRSVRVEVPKKFTSDQVALAAKDSEIIAGILKDHPHEFEQIVSYVTAGNISKAKKVASEIGLTEKDFVKKRGGCWAVVIVIAVIAAVALEHD